MKFQLIFLVICFVSVRGENRIAGGDATQINAYPYATALLTNKGEGNDYLQACGGTVITNNAILSAASCFYTNGIADEVAWWRARVGSALSDQGGIVHLLQRINNHPDFSITTRVNDLAVLRTTVNIVQQWGSVERAYIAGGAYQLGTNQPIWAIGWGITTTGGNPAPQLRHVQFWVVDQTTCANRYAELGYMITANMICTGWLDVGVRGQCEGDGGSPLVENGVVVGVHSYAEGCAQGWYPGVNTRIAPYTRWIVDTAIAA